MAQAKSAGPGGPWGDHDCLLRTQQRQWHHADAVGAAVGVGAGVDDDRVEQVRSEALRQPVQVNRVP